MIPAPFVFGFASGPFRCFTDAAIRIAEGRLLNFLSRRKLSIGVVPEQELHSDRTPSLFAVGSAHLPSGYSESRHSWNSLNGLIVHFGFASSWHESPADPSRRTYDFSLVSLAFDRLLRIAIEGDVRAAARVEIRECRVRDDQIRADLNHTGYELSVAVREEAFRAIQDHLDAPMLEDEDNPFAESSRRMILRIPTKPFIVPPTRGNRDPWDTSGDCVGRLKRIRQFNAPWLDVTRMSWNPMRAPIMSGLQDRFAPWLRSTLRIRAIL